MEIRLAMTSTLAAALGRRCPYCLVVMETHGRYQPTRDHVLPRAKYNGKKPALVIVCRGCNADKGMMTLREYRAALMAASDRRRAALIDMAIKRFPDFAGDYDPPVDLIILSPDPVNPKVKKWVCRVCSRRSKTLWSGWKNASQSDCLSASRNLRCEPVQAGA